MQRPSRDPSPEPGVVTIRWAQHADLAAVRRLAALDCQGAPPIEQLLLAEVDSELWAAASADGRRRLADPFRLSGGLLELLLARAAQLRGSAVQRPRPLLSRAPGRRLTTAT